MNMSPVPAILSLLLLCVTAVRSISIELNGENVYSVDYKNLQYFLFIEDKEATITCSVIGISTAPTMRFLKEGRALDTVLPNSLYNLETETSEDGQTHRLKLKIDASGYTNIVGNWTCNVETSNGEQTEKPFKTLCTSKPYITFSPDLVHGVAREGTTITMSCNCDSLDELRDDRDWGWFIDNASPAGNRLSYEGAGSEDGYPTDVLVISNLEDIDTAPYSCNCKVGPQKTVQFNSLDVQMTVMRPPGIPKDISLLEATMDTLSIAWKNADDMGVVLDYKISYKRTGTSAYREVSTGVSVTQHILTNLDPLTEYSIKIAAANNAGSGTPSSVVTFTTAQPSESLPIIIGPQNLPVNENSHYMIDTSVGIDIALSCEVNSYPAPIVEWMFNDKIITTEPTSGMANNFERSVLTKSDFTTEHVLIIKSTRPANGGTYSCVASNTEGKAVLTYVVQVTPEDTEEDAEESRSPAVSTTPLTAFTIVSSLTVTMIMRIIG